MDSGATLLLFHHLAGLPPYTSPPPWGERNKQSRRTTSHTDSHTMGDHEDEIPELSSSPPEIWKEDPTPVYDPSPDIPTHSRFNPSHDIPTHSRYDPSFTSRRYWLLGDETHHEPTSTSYIRYGIPDIPAHDLAHHAELEIEPSTTLGGNPIPFHAERFGSTSHIAPSIR